ncbi:hypothetical protein FG05_35410 [Fusarium graminearum]|nr:hypothetical protein FG05_35410 [Fusarium graminearum]
MRQSMNLEHFCLTCIIILYESYSKPRSNPINFVSSSTLNKLIKM